MDILCIPREADVVMDEQAEESDKAEGVARVFDQWTNFSGRNFSEELGLPYADKMIYKNIIL